MKQQIAVMLALLLSSAVLGVAGCDNESKAAPSASDGGAGVAILNDQQSAEVLNVANGAEVAQGLLAGPRATEADIKAYAQRMVNEHSAIQQRQRQLYQQVGIIPEPTATSTQLQSTANTTLQDEQQRGGRDFDLSYLLNEIKQHQNLLNLIDQAMLPGAQNAQFKAALASFRATEQDHLTAAQQLVARFFGTAGADAGIGAPTDAGPRDGGIGGPIDGGVGGPIDSGVGGPFVDGGVGYPGPY
ncbi:MAG TPA: DUF4142 domain-containing protein [Polyangia bacterium]|jgi:putative membrane protein